MDGIRYTMASCLCIEVASIMYDSLFDRSSNVDHFMNALRYE